MQNVPQALQFAPVVRAAPLAVPLIAYFQFPHLFQSQTFALSLTPFDHAPTAECPPLAFFESLAFRVLQRLHRSHIQTRGRPLLCHETLGKSAQLQLSTLFAIL